MDEIMNPQEYWVIRNKDTGEFFCGQGTWSKRLNGANIYILEKKAQETVTKYHNQTIWKNLEVVKIIIAIIEPIRNNNTDFFTPAQVRKMTSKEIHDNYTKIMESMKLWN